MLHSRPPLHHRSSQLPSCPLRSSRPCLLSKQHCIPSRRSLLACTAKKEDGKADGRGGKPSWACLWTGGSQDTPNKDTSQPSPPSSGSSRPSPLLSRRQNRSADSTHGPSIAGSQDAQGKDTTSRSSPPRSSSISSRPSALPPSRGQSSSRDTASRAGSQDACSGEAPGSSLPSSSSGNRPSQPPQPMGQRNSSSRISSRPSPPPPLRGRSSSRSSRHEDSRTGDSTSRVPELKRERSPSSSSSDRSRSSSSSSSNRGRPLQSSSKRFRESISPNSGYQSKGALQDLGSCLQRAHTAKQPQQCSKVLLDLENCVQQDKQAVLKYSAEHPHEIEAAAGALTAKLLGSSSSSSSTSTSTIAAAPFQKLDGKQLCLSVSGFASLADCNSSIMTRQLHQLVDGIAVHVVESNILDRPADKACMQWARLLYNIAKLGIKCQDSQLVQQLFDVAAQKFPHLLRQNRRKQAFKPQDVSNALWTFATADFTGNLRGLVAEVASNEAQAMESANSQVSDSQGWSDTLWALGALTEGCIDLGERRSVDAIMGAGAASMEQVRSRSDPGYISRSLWGIAKAGYHAHDSITSKLAMAVAEHSSKATPQALSNTLWALATLGCNFDASTVSKLANAMAEHASDAAPQNLSNALWAVATLGCTLDDGTVRKLADAVAERSSDAAPQALSNTLWALATLDCNPDASTVSQLASAFVERSSDAKPQELSNTLWALPQLDWYDAHQIQLMVTALAQQQSSPASTAQHYSNVLQALGSLRWYDAARYSQLVEGVLLKISHSAPEAAGQHFSNAMFSCALSCHFDSSVDALAEWGSQQSLHNWTGQHLSNALYAWAILSATAGGNTASMHKLAQHLFAEASSRGVAAFQARPEWRRDMGKLFSAHQEALHVCLPGGGVADGELLEAARSERARVIDVVSKQLSHITSAVSAALQGVCEVQASMIEGYYALLVHHPSCPRGVAIAITHPQRDYMRHPSGQLFGKTALRVEQMKRGCDGVVLCDEAEVQGKSVEQLREMLVQCIEQAAKG